MRANKCLYISVSDLATRDIVLRLGSLYLNTDLCSKDFFEEETKNKLKEFSNQIKSKLFIKHLGYDREGEDIQAYLVQAINELKPDMVFIDNPLSQFSNALSDSEIENIKTSFDREDLTDDEFSEYFHDEINKEKSIRLCRFLRDLAIKNSIPFTITSYPESDFIESKDFNYNKVITTEIEKDDHDNLHILASSSMQRVKFTVSLDFEKCSFDLVP